MEKFNMKSQSINNNLAGNQVAAAAAGCSCVGCSFCAACAACIIPPLLEIILGPSLAAATGVIYTNLQNG